MVTSELFLSQPCSSDNHTNKLYLWVQTLDKNVVDDLEEGGLELEKENLYSGLMPICPVVINGRR